MVRPDANVPGKMNGSMGIPNGRISVPPVIPNTSMSSLGSWVPVDVRRKIQLMLLLRHNTLGCDIRMVQDEYKVYYREDIFPQMFGYKNWIEMLKSMPEHVQVGVSRGCKIVNGLALGQNLAISYLNKIFATPTDISDEGLDDHQVSNLQAVEPLQNGTSGDKLSDPFLDELLGFNVPSDNIENTSRRASSEDHSSSVTNVGVNGLSSITDSRLVDLAIVSEAEPQDLSETLQSSSNIAANPESASASFTLRNVRNHLGSTPKSEKDTGNNINESSDTSVSEISKNDRVPAPVIKRGPAGVSAPTDGAANSMKVESKNESRTLEEKPGSNRKRNSTSTDKLDEEQDVQIIEVIPKSKAKRSRLDISALSKNLRIQIVSPSNPRIFTVCPLVSSAASVVPLTSSTISSAIVNGVNSSNSVSVPRASSTSLPADQASLVTIPEISKQREEPPQHSVLEQQSSVENNSVTPVIIPGEPLITHFNEGAALNEKSDPIPSTSSSNSAIPVAKTPVQASSVASSPAANSCENSSNCLSESTKKLVASLPKCEVKLTRLKLRTDTPPPSPEDKSPLRRRKHSGCSATSSNSSVRDNKRCSPRLQEKANTTTPVKKTPSPSKLGPKKTPAKGKGRRLPVENDGDEIDPVRDVPFPRWYRSRNESDQVVEQEYENFMKYSALPIQNYQLDVEGGDENFPCGPYFPSDCKINMDELTLHLELGKTADYLRYHLFWSLMPENLPRDGWEIHVDDHLVFPLMNLESYQIAELDHAFGSEISQHGNYSSQLNVVSSYGNYADYFLWKRGPKSRCLGIMPDNGKGMAKLRYSSGISYDKFNNFRDDLVDIFDPVTTRDIENHVEAAFPDKMDVFIANGIGFPGMKNRSEDLALVQTLLALKLVREGGIFILKINNTTSDFFVGLVFYLGHCFSKITIEKPESALPGEKFLVCFWKLKDEHLKKIQAFFDECNLFRIEQNWEQSDLCINSIFGFDDLHSVEIFSTVDAEFVHFIRMHNEEISQKELNMTMGMVNRYEHVVNDSDNTTEDKSVKEGHINEQMLSERNSLLAKWNLHLRERSTDPISFNDLPQYIVDWVQRPSETTRVSSVVAEGNWLKTGLIEQWSFILSTRTRNRAVVLVKPEDPRDSVCQYKAGVWESIPGLILPRGTIVYAEIIPASKSRRPIFNIIDANSLGERSLETAPYSKRLEECSEFISSHLTPSNKSYCITCSTEFSMQSLPDILLELSISRGKFNARYFKTALCEPSTTKSTSTDLNMDVGDIVFFQTKTNFGGIMASAGWQTFDFGRLIFDEVSWEWISALKVDDVVPSLRTLVAGEQCFPRILFSFGVVKD
ncbi:unnamed protein product [Allacma fusca]|uniref:Ribosomal RNA methyltransferase FtsJ domain-containing protein n=1 Tax=Allacma fusca TaxID=39272 RepID=A0A8J2KNE3_9HEXA|nr:unnamed protein product [Allacma fusca]